MKSDKNQCLKYIAIDIFYEHCLVSSQIAITQDFQQTGQKGKKQSTWDERQHHKLKNKNFINHLRKLAFSSINSFEGLQNAGEKCDESAQEQ